MRAATGIKPFTALVNQVMTAEPYASAKRVFWVVDNGASHRNWAAAARMRDVYPNAQMVHLPVHASWLNQVYFSVIQRKLLTPDNFGDLDSLAGQILAFEQHYNATARPGEDHRGPGRGGRARRGLPGADGGLVTVNLDATILIAHSEKEQATATWKKHSATR